MPETFQVSIVNLYEGKKQELIEQATNRWVETTKLLEDKMEKYRQKYKDLDIARFKFEAKKHRVLFHALKDFDKDVKKSEYDNTESEIRKEIKSALIKVHLNSFVSRLELMHEYDTPAKIEILRRMADTTEGVSKDLFNTVIDILGNGRDVSEYKKAIEDAEKGLAQTEANFMGAFRVELRR